MLKTIKTKNPRSVGCGRMQIKPPQVSKSKPKIFSSDSSKNKLPKTMLRNKKKPYMKNTFTIRFIKWNIKLSRACIRDRYRSFGGGKKDILGFNFFFNRSATTDRGDAWCVYSTCVYIDEEKIIRPVLAYPIYSYVHIIYRIQCT